MDATEARAKAQGLQALVDSDPRTVPNSDPVLYQVCNLWECAAELPEKLEGLESSNANLVAIEANVTALVTAATAIQASVTAIQTSVATLAADVNHIRLNGLPSGLL